MGGIRMKFFSKRIIISFLIVVFSIGLVGETVFAQAGNYPNKPIQILLIHKAGSSTDTIARTLQIFLSKELGVNVVIQNLPGGGGTQAMYELQKAKPDGYTLLMTPFPSATLKQVLTPNAGFDVRDFTYVAGVSSGDNNTLAVSASSNLKTIKDFIEAGKTRKLKISGSGMNTNGHLIAGLLLDYAKLNFTYVPFEGGPEAITAVLGNHVDATVADIVGAVPLVNSGKLRLVAVAGSKRDRRFPDVPTFAESGYPDIAVDNVVGIIGPKDLPAAIVDKLSDALKKVTANTEFIDAGAKTGFTVAFTNSEDLNAISLKLLDTVIAEKDVLVQMGK